MSTFAVSRRSSATYTQRRASSALPTQWTRAVQTRATKRSNKHLTQETHDVDRLVDEATASSQGLFNDNFKAALAGAIARQGSKTLLEGQEKLADEHQLSGQEEVLRAAIMAAKSTLLKLQMIKTEAEKSIEAETKQIERLQFALEKARSDAAYYRTIQNMNSSDIEY